MSVLFKKLDDLFLTEEVQVTQKHCELWQKLKVKMTWLLATERVVVDNMHVTELIKAVRNLISKKKQLQLLQDTLP